MARCGCSSDCNCTVAAAVDEGIAVSGAGSAASPYLVGVVLSADAGQQASFGSDGGLLAESSVGTADTDCIALDGDGSPGDPLTASPILDPDGGLSCTVLGLKASLLTLPILAVQSISGPTAVLDGEMAPANTISLGDATGGDLNLNLPDAIDSAGQVVVVKKITAPNDIILTPGVGSTIDGAADLTLSAQWASVTLVAAASNWFVIGSI